MDKNLIFLIISKESGSNNTEGGGKLLKIICLGTDATNLDRFITM